MFKDLISRIFSFKSPKPTVENTEVVVSHVSEIKVDNQPTNEPVIEVAPFSINSVEDREVGGEVIEVETNDDRNVMDRLVADGRLEVLYGENNSMTVKALGKIEDSEYQALDEHLKSLPMIMEGETKKLKKKSTSISKGNHGLAVDEPYKKLNYCTEIIDYSKKGNPINAVSMFLQSEPMFKTIMGDYAQRLSKATKILLPTDGRIIDVKVKDGTLKEQFGPYIQHFKLPYENIAFEINYRPNEDQLDENIPCSSIQMVFLCEQISSGINLTVFYKNIEGFWLVVNELPITLRDDFSRPMTAIKNIDVFNKADSDVKGAFQDFIEFASSMTYEFLCAINCSNIDTSQEIKAGKFANQKRKEKKKAPLFDYKVLVLDLTHKKNDQGETSGGTYTKKRAHLRRGHIRRLKDKTIWVNSCAVGGRAEGVIEKDYEIKKIVQA